MLPALKEAVDNNEALMRNYAYLFDRVQTSEGKLQRWGTQSRCEDHRAVLYPIEEPYHVDERRHNIGLNSLEASVQQSTLVCAHVSQ